MPRFSYRAVDASGELVEGEMDSADRNALVGELRRKGYLPLHTQAQGGGGRLRLSLPTARRGGRMSGADLALLTRELSTLLSAGLPLDQALSSIAQQTGKPAVAEIVQSVLDKVRGGSSFAAALGDHADVFPSYYVGLVRAGEAGGSLDSVLQDLADTQERTQALRGEVRAALNYPILVLFAAGFSVVVLLVGVIPEFEPLFRDAGTALPLTTRAVLAASTGLRQFWWLLVLAVLAAVLIVARLRREPAVKARMDARLLAVPLIGPLLRKVAAARFCRTLGTLLTNGVDVVPALEMAAGTVGNARLAQAVVDTAPRLRRGEGLAEPLKAAAVFPPLAERLIQVGEASGQLDRMLLTAARILEEEVARDTRKLVSLLVPVVTLLLGVLVAGIIGAILSAILTSYDLPF